jgi:6,7-dimethyl-8-ribityllumazine synthase
MSDRAPQISIPPVPKLKLGIAASLYNQSYVDQLLNRASAVLAEAGHPVPPEAVIRVPGAMELPFAVELLARQPVAWDGFVVLGLVLAGKTQHHTLISDSTATAFHHFTARTGLPIINGILVVDDVAQAEERISGRYDRGAEFARALLQTAHLYHTLCPNLKK